ncbi:MAG: AAA family ATPase [Prevotella sp.]|jgi:cytidylate kinase
MERIIITIGRQIGSGGRDIAKWLAEEFHCKFYDKEILNLAAKESGFKERFFEQNDEKKNFFQSLSHFRHPFFAPSDYSENSFSQEKLYQFQSDAILKAAKEGNCVFVGRTADYILRNMDGVVNIFITADIDQRIQNVCRRKGIDRKCARKLIKEGESERASYYNYYTGKRWGHSESYDLCINSSILGIEETALFIADFIRKKHNLES